MIISYKICRIIWYHLISFNACGWLSKLSKKGQNNRMATRGLNEFHLNNFGLAKSHTGPLLSTMSLHVCGACQCTRQLDKLHIRGQKCWNVLKIVSPCFSMVLPCCSVPSLLKVQAPNEVYWTNADRLAKPLLTWFNGTTSPGQKNPGYQSWHSDLSVSEEGSKLTPHWDSYPRMNSDGSHVSCRNWEPVGLPWDTLWDSKLGWSPEPVSNPACCRQVLESFPSVQQNVWDTGIPWDTYDMMQSCPFCCATSFCQLAACGQSSRPSFKMRKNGGHRSRWGKKGGLAQFWARWLSLHTTRPT